VQPKNLSLFSIKLPTSTDIKHIIHISKGTNMHYVIGILLSDSNVEIIENDDPEKGNFMGLMVAMKRGEEMMKENPKFAN